jgi:hypothetical protein
MTLFRRGVGDRERGQIFQQLPPSSWIKIPSSNFLITGAVFIVFVLDMASPGYGQFALIPNWRLNIASLTTDVRSDLESLMRSKSSPSNNAQKQPTNKDCQTLLDAYRKGAKCQFEPPTYSDISPQKSNIRKLKQ